MIAPGAGIRPDLQRIADLIAPDTKVLDVGCSDGELLDHLWRTKNVDGRGIELGQDGVHASVKRGLSVIQGDADTDLDVFPDSAFSYAVLSQTIQAMRDPRRVLANLVRIADHAIVSLPNFAYWRMRLSLMWNGRMPVTKTLPYQWYDTPNIHFCTIRDFVALCQSMDIHIERAMVVRRGGTVAEASIGRRANWLGEQGIFLLRRGGQTGQQFRK